MRRSDFLAVDGVEIVENFFTETVLREILLRERNASTTAQRSRKK